MDLFNNIIFSLNPMTDKRELVLGLLHVTKITDTSENAIRDLQQI